VYLKLDFVSKESPAYGYLRAGGSLDVLGLISASVEFLSGFTYYFGPPCKIAGEASVTIEVPRAVLQRVPCTRRCGANSAIPKFPLPT